MTDRKPEARNRYNREIKPRRALAKKQGLCVHCFHPLDRAGALCRACCRKHSRIVHGYRVSRRQRSQCPMHAGYPQPCPRCAAYAKRMAVRRRAAGICISCAEKLDELSTLRGHVRCTRCIEGAWVSRQRRKKKAEEKVA